MLRTLANKNPSTLHIGIESNSKECEKARLAGLPKNAVLLEGAFSEFLPRLPASSIDFALALFPDPSYIDERRLDAWGPLYADVLAKLKPGGTLRVVTELTDELLQPVQNSVYERWVEWLKSAFQSLGFVLVSASEGAPQEYSSRCLDQFRGDPQRIRIVTLDLQKP